MSKNLFNSIKLMRPKNNVFDLTHDVKLSTRMGKLTPIMVQECVPGDKFAIATESLIRMAPMIAPVMHRLDVTMHYFFVPNRILWPNWEKFIVNDPSNPVFPTFSLTPEMSFAELADYMGVPAFGGSGTLKISAMPFAAYQKIYDEYYRDQNLITSTWSELIDGDNSADWDTKWNIMRRRAWEHDYFTAALPFAQKGSAVDIPLGEGTVEWNPTNPGAGNPRIRGVVSGLDNTGDLSAAAGQLQNTGGGVQPALGYDPNGTLTTQIEPTTINDLRRAFKLQEWLERNARGGTRYIENILAHFGVKSSDKRLQRPEYITGSKSPIVISEILNTTGEAAGLPQGNMAGHGYAVNNGHQGSYYCEEHGYIIGVMSIMPKTAYQQGLPKHFLKFDDPFQYFWPTFAHLGEQEVLNKELYVDHSNPNGTFGYVPRYAEYKFTPNRVAGDFKTSLDFWHLGRIFSTDPALNQAFVECNPDDRIFAVEDGSDNFYCHVLNKVKAIRPMPKFGTPMM